MAHQHPPRFLKIVNDAKQRVRETSVDAVKARLDRGEKFVLVDVREDREFDSDHLPGAVHMGRASLNAILRPSIPICTSNSCSIAAAASVPPWPPTTCRRWDTPMSSPWTVESAIGAKRAIRWRRSRKSRRANQKKHSKRLLVCIPPASLKKYS